LSDEKKLSIAALSQTLPERLIEQRMIGQQFQKLLSGVLAPAIGMMQRRIGLAGSPDRHHRASVTSSAVIAAVIDQSTARRENWNCAEIGRSMCSLAS
jgi:hypothetical protein